MATGPLTLGPKPPEVTMPMRVARRRQDLGALARRRAAVGLDADAAARGAVRELVLDARGAGEAALAAPPLLDRPGEPGLDRASWSRRCRGRRGRGRPRAAASRARRGRSACTLRLAPAAAARRAAAVGRGHRDLEAVLAGVAGARDVAVEAADACADRRHERRAAAPRRKARQHRARRRAPAARAARARARARASRRPAGGWRCARSRPPCARR